MMRIIGGEYRSRLISVPKGAPIRPTQDRTREAVFNLVRDMTGKRVLDLFAGSGALGIEALSRGADYATFVDNSSRCVMTIRSNLDSLKVPQGLYHVIRADAFKALKTFDRNGDRFDIIFLDPPYYHNIAKKSLIMIDSYDILSRVALVIVEHSKADTLETSLNTLKLEKERHYGDTTISIYRKEEKGL